MNYQGDRDVAGAPTHSGNETAVPLCIDLDGTLVKTDLLLESSLALLKLNPLYLFLFPVWLLRGKAHLKREIARRVRLNPETLPYHQALLDYLREEHAAGRRLVLATASDELLAQPVAHHLGIFSEVMASDGRTNLSGANKGSELCSRFGRAGFAYAGNGRADLAVWPHACYCIVVNATERMTERVKNASTHVRAIPDRELVPPWRAFVKAIRVHQWVKNLLIFVPLLTAHRLSDMSGVWAAALAFSAFSLCSSSVYLLNDLLDLEADRQHPTKRARPFASGNLPILTGLAAIPLFLLGGVALAASLRPGFLAVLLTYFALTLGYSFYLKQIVLLDVLVLALLYTLRIIAGAVAVAVALSPWLLAFSMFLFLSLALVKRFSELRALRIANKHSAKGRGYLAGDLEQLASLGAASGYIAVLVLALYINSQEVTALYRNPVALWVICPVILYWVSRVWLLAHRGQIDQDPIVFALHDRTSYSIGIVIALAMLVAL